MWRSANSELKNWDLSFEILAMMKHMIHPRMAITFSLLTTIFAASCTAPQNFSNTQFAPQQPGYETQVTNQPAVGYYAPPERMEFARPSNVAPNAPSIHAESYILVNARNGSVIAARNADMPHHVASTQKILTALIVAESGNLDAMVRIAPSDVDCEPSKLGVRPGEMYSRRQLLIGFLVKSSNDVAEALARDNAGSIEAFAQKMNAKARSLGAMNSRFVNPHGLTAPGQRSCARDMARIALACYENPIIRDAVRRKYFSFTFANGKTVKLENTNEILGRMPECDGMKTGYTGPAGRCLVSCAHNNSRDVILVQLGTHTKYIWNDGITLMRFGLGR